MIKLLFFFSQVGIMNFDVSSRSLFFRLFHIFNVCFQLHFVLSTPRALNHFGVEFHHFIKHFTITELPLRRLQIVMMLMFTVILNSQQEILIFSAARISQTQVCIKPASTILFVLNININGKQENGENKWLIIIPD